MPATTLPPRCSSGDLRMQWSCAHARAGNDPGGVARLRARVDATLELLAREVAEAPPGETPAALRDEIDEVRRVAASIDRAIARSAPPPANTAPSRRAL